MEARYLRIVYSLQFIVTCMAIFEIWGQVGGQGHLDLMPWYAKLTLDVALSLVVVKATAAAVRRDRFWNWGTCSWLGVAAILIVAMGLLTRYEHLHEPADEDEEPPARVLG